MARNTGCVQIYAAFVNYFSSFIILLSRKPQSGGFNTSEEPHPRPRHPKTFFQEVHAVFGQCANVQNSAFLQWPCLSINTPDVVPFTTSVAHVDFLFDLFFFKMQVSF